MDSAPNSLTVDPLGGRYRLGAVIGRGGMASVYTARDLNLGRDVALKLFNPQSADPDELRRQEAEIRLLATLNHPGLVTLFDAGTDTRVPGEPRPFLTMELIDGQDLRTRIRQGAVPLAEIAVFAAGVADALTYVHSLGIVHRDIKPANILLVPSGPGEPPRPKLTDFGVARIIDGGTRLTTTGTMVGTAAYLSPEQARGAEIGPASDIYSLGLVLLECFKGELEYPGGAIESAVARLHRDPMIPADVPSEWAGLIRAMTGSDPALRPSAAALAVSARQAVATPSSLPAALPDQHSRASVTPPARPAQPPRLAADPPTAAGPARADAGPHERVLADQAANEPGSETTVLRLPGDAAAPATSLLPTAPSAPGRGPRRRTAGSPGPGGHGPAGHGPAGHPLLSRLRPTRRRTWVLLTLAVVAFSAATAAVTASVPANPAPDVVSYPAVTGSLGDKLQQLQESVKP